jgi:hypothetical protein
VETLLDYFASRATGWAGLTLEQADLSSVAVARLRQLMARLPEPITA